MKFIKWLWPSFALTIFNMALGAPLILIVWIFLEYIGMAVALPYIAGIAAVVLFIYHLHGFLTDPHQNDVEKDLPF